MKYSAALPSDLHRKIINHLIRPDGQEDLCFALWNPSTGKDRKTALIFEPILPQQNERVVHNNVAFLPNYLERAIGLAVKNGRGLSFMHSHPYPGWQNLSGPDKRAEGNIAGAVKGATGLPLLGMTVGTDGAWSARFWERTGPRSYQHHWCETTRVVGDAGIEITFNDKIYPPPRFRDRLTRTVSAWGQVSQAKLARTKFGIVGVGSVGSIIAESLARMGISNIKLIDFDFVEEINLDRLLHCSEKDIGRLKIEAIARAIRRSTTSDSVKIEKIPFSIVEEEGYRNAIDCDILFSCVDRPWPRSVLNLIAYAHLIPVIDGGILIQTTKSGRLKNADWKAHIAAPSRRCLECLGQYDPANVQLEREGYLDNQTYIKTLSGDSTLRRNENVFGFSINLASLQILQMLSMVVAPMGITNVGEQSFHFVNGRMDIENSKQCRKDCIYQKLTGSGDKSEYVVVGRHVRAEKLRSKHRQTK